MRWGAVSPVLYTELPAPRRISTFNFPPARVAELHAAISGPFYADQDAMTLRQAPRHDLPGLLDDPIEMIPAKKALRV
jgi:hypothetical protein